MQIRKPRRSITNKGRRGKWCVYLSPVVCALGAKEVKGIERKEEVQRCQEAGAKALEGQKEPRVAPGYKHHRGSMRG